MHPRVSTYLRYSWGRRRSRLADRRAQRGVRFLRTSVIGLLFLSAANLASGAPATPETGARIEAAVRTYLGRTDGVVSVVPSGDTYDLTLDAAPLFSRARAGGTTGTLTPIHLTLGELGEGRWSIRQAEPLRLTLTVPGSLALDLSSQEVRWSGIFDTSLMAFTESQGNLSGLTIVERISEPDGPVTHVTYRIDQFEMNTSGKAGIGGGVDGTLSYVATGLSETVTVEGGPTAAMPMSFDVTAARYAVATETRGVRTSGLYALLAWAVAQSPKGASETDFDALRALTRAALPLWDNVSGTGELRDIRLSTPFGTGGAESASFAIELNGVVHDGLFREKVSLKGLEFPSALMAPWVSPLAPDEVALDITVEGFDLAAPAEILLDEAEAGVAPSGEMSARLLSALLPEGRVSVTIAPGNAISPTYALQYEGAFDVGPDSMPEGSVTIGATGLQAALEALNAAPENIRSGAVPGLMMLRGIARPSGSDAFSWKIGMTADGKILVNGLDMSALAGGMK